MGKLPSGPHHRTFWSFLILDPPACGCPRSGARARPVVSAGLARESGWQGRVWTALQGRGTRGRDCGGLGASILRVRDLARVKRHVQDQGKRLALGLGGLFVFPPPTQAPSPALARPWLRLSHSALLRSVPCRPHHSSHQSRQRCFHSTPRHSLLSSHGASPRHRGEPCGVWSLSCSCIWRPAIVPSLRLPRSLPGPWGLGPNTSCPKSPSLAMSLDISGWVFDGVMVEGI